MQFTRVNGLARTAHLFLALPTLALAVACGGDDSTTPNNKAAGAGGQATTGAGGTDATGGNATTGTGTTGAGTTGNGGTSAAGTGGTDDTSGNAGSGGGDTGNAGGGAGQASLDAGQTDAQPAVTPDAGNDAPTVDPGQVYDPCPPKGTVCAIMPMGDSITEGFRSTGYGGYRAPLFHLALQDKKSITFVGSAPLHGPATVDGVAFPQANEGVGGRRISSLVSIVPTTITTNKPNILLLEIGTNDIGEGATSMASQLGSLLDKLIAADSKMLVIVATVIPTTTDSKTVVVKAYDDLIPGLVKTRADAGKHIIMVDMYATFTANPNWKMVYFKSTDDLHPSDAGYSKMADVWYAALKPLLP